MSDHVALQIALVEESLAARCTDVRVGICRLSRRSVSAHVCLQRGRSSYASPADSTLVTGLQMNESGVRSQRIEALVDASTDGTSYGDTAMMLVHVSLNADLRLVLFIADAAVVMCGIQMPRGKVLRHILRTPSNSVAQLTGILGLAMIYNHVDLQFVRRHESLAA